MHKAVRWTLLFSLIAISFAVAWDFTPRSAGRNKGKVDVKTSSSAAKLHSNRQAALQATTRCGRMDGVAHLLHHDLHRRFA